MLKALTLAEILVMGREVGAVDLALGSPSFPATGSDLIAGACAAMRQGHNQYEDLAGHRPLRMAVAAQHEADADTEITITAGATEGLNVVLQALVQPGDEVVVIEPCFEIYCSAIRLAGAQPQPVPLSGPEWRWDCAQLAAAFGPRTKAVLVNSPNNPTGRILTLAELAELAALCAQWDAVLISDEVYAEFVDSPGSAVFPWQLPELAERVVALRSLSKSHAISGWRIGWIYAPPAQTRVFRMVHEALTAGCAAPLQVAAAHVLRERPGWSEAERGALKAKRRTIVAALSEAGLECALPQGAAFVLARLPVEVPGTAAKIARRLVTEHRLTAAPGGLFFSDQAVGERYLRFAYNKSEAVLAAGVDRISDSAPLFRHGIEADGLPTNANVKN